MGHMHLNRPIGEDLSQERSTSKQKGPRIAPRAFLLFTPFSFAYAFFFRVETLRAGVFLAAVFFFAPLEAAADVFAAGFTAVATRLVVRLGLASASVDSSDLRVLRRRLGVSAAGSTMGSETAIGATAGSSTGAGSASVPETASVRRRRVSRGIFGGSGAKVKLGGGGSTATAAGS